MTSYCIELNWSGIANVTSSFAIGRFSWNGMLYLQCTKREKNLSIYSHTQSICIRYSLRYHLPIPFIRHSVFIVFICYCSGIVLESQRNQDVANILHVFTYEFEFFLFSHFSSLLQFNTINNSHAYSILYPSNCHRHSFSCTIQFDLCGHSGRCDSSF